MSQPLQAGGVKAAPNSDVSSILADDTDPSIADLQSAIAQIEIAQGLLFRRGLTLTVAILEDALEEARKHL